MNMKYNFFALKLILYFFLHGFNPCNAQNFYLFSWGNNESGELGLGDTAKFLKYNSPRLVGNDSTWSIVSSDFGITTAIKNDGSLWSWGEQYNGELGIGLPNKFKTQNPIRIGNDNDWIDISTSNGHTIALKSKGTLWGWGLANYGADTVIQNHPVQIGTDTNWKVISVGSAFSIAIKSDGTLWSWGVGADGAGNFCNKPKRIGTGNIWKYISAGLQHTIALKNDGTLWSWGYNGNGQLGIGIDTINEVYQPIQIGNDTNWRMISAGSRYSLALKTDGSLWSWGDNSFGQLGLGNQLNSNSPKLINNDKDWTDICAAAFHTSAIKRNGTLWNWGENNWGQLGRGNFVSNKSPVKMGKDSNWFALGRSVGASTFAIKKITPKTLSMTLSHFRNKKSCVVYPNPTSEFLFICNIKNIQIEFKIYNSNGTLLKNGFTFEKIDISQLKPGLYFLTTNIGNNTFIKE